MPPNRRFTSPRGRKLTGLAKKYPRPPAAELHLAVSPDWLDSSAALPRRVLVADGCSDTAAGAASVLARAGYRVTTASASVDTMHALARERFDLVLLGDKLGNQSGMQVLRSIRSHARAAELRTDPGAVRIVLTLECERPRYEETRYLALANGADDVLVRPFDARELLIRVVVLLRRTNAKREDGLDLLRLGPLCIDFAGHRVTMDGDAVRLTRSEFILLRALVERRGQLCSRAELNAARSGDTNPGTGRGVDMQISRMRRKLGPAGEMIENVRGEGYRLRRAGEPGSVTASLHSGPRSDTW